MIRHDYPQIDARALVEPTAQIGWGTRVWAFAQVRDNAIVGKNCTLGHAVFVEGGARIGDGCKLQNGVSVYRGVTLMDRVFCGPHMTFTNVRCPRAALDKKHEIAPTLVGHDATLGAHATIVCGVKIGAYAFVGAGAVVTEDVPPYARFLGVPAVPHGWVCRCGEPLATWQQGYRCTRCPAMYVLDEGGMQPRGNTK